MGRASVPTPTLYPAFFFVLEKAVKSAGNAVIPTFPAHCPHGLQHLRYKRPTFAFADESGYTLAFANRIAHSGLHAETWGFTLAIGGAFRSHSHIEAMKSRRKRMHALWRVSASFGTAAPLGCATFFSVCLCCISHARHTGISACARQGGYHHSRRALRAAETPDGRLSKRLTCRFLRLGGHH